MTLSTLASRVTYPGAGSVGPYAIPFRFTTALDLEVIVREANGNEIPLAYPTDFTVTGAGNAAGTLTLAVALAVGEILAIHRAPALTQATSIRNQGTYFPATIEDEFDRLVMQLQDLQDQLDRTFGVSSSFDPATLDLRLRPETGKALVWQSATELGNSSIVSSGVALPGAGRTVATLTAYLLNNQVYNVLDYGALGDGVTNDKAALKAAIAAAPASSTVWFPRTGQYYYVSIAAGENDAIDVNKKLTVIIDGTIQSSVGAIQPNPPTIFLVTGNDVTFGGSGVVRGEGTINALNAGIPAELPSLVKVTGNNFIWTGLTIDSPYKVGIHLYGAYHATITGARFTGGPVAYGSPGTTGYFAIRGEQGGRAIISNNQFYPGGLTGGMYVSCIFLNNCSWSVVDSNQAYRPYEKLVYGAMSYSVISNNVVVGRDPAAGAIPGTNQFGTLGPVYRCDGQYNKIIGNFSQYGGGAQSLGGIGLDVSGNTFLDCAQGGIGIIETGAVGAMNHMTVHNNLITCGNIPNTNIADGIYIRTPNNPPGYGPNRYLRVTNNTVTGFAVADPTVNFTIGNGGTRLPNTQYSVDTHAVRPTAGPNGFYYVAIVSGVTAGGGDPAWPVVALGTVVDGGVTWQAIDPETAIHAQIRLTALYAGGEINRALIAGNNLAGGLRGLYLQRVDHSEIFNNRIQAATWGITEVNCSNNRFGFNPIETAANPGIETVSATAVVAGYQQGAWAPAIGEAGAGLAAMAGGGANGGFWVRNGRAVTVTANVVTTGFGTIAGGTAIRILNLPFACANGAGAAAGAVFGNFAGGALPVAGMSISVVAVNNATYLLLHKWSAVTGTTALTMAEWAAAGGGSFSLTYFTDAPFLSL